ncbi:hypothetical protein B9479_007481 [Cryptococcus floricola]|uniref:CxC1-like cysteine cluster associated with KDZ transposases domain-containing protein n=1 Tax=Cryptococcus floricola TaxID=2591691 RepID=A0A5D3APH6_9TREE|nr:hypothetical protein B9479_007481 [Cryptococcus floricola]
MPKRSAPTLFFPVMNRKKRGSGFCIPNLYRPGAPPLRGKAAEDEMARIDREVLEAKERAEKAQKAKMDKERANPGQETANPEQERTSVEREESPDRGWDMPAWPQYDGIGGGRLDEGDECSDEEGDWEEWPIGEGTQSTPQAQHNHHRPRTRQRRYGKRNTSYRVLMTNKENNWSALRSTMFLHFMQYYQRSNKLQESVDIRVECGCRCQGGQLRPRLVTLVSWDNQVDKVIDFCACPEPITLIQLGFVATSPVRPTMGMALSLLQYVHVAWSFDPRSIDLTARSLWEHHSQRGGVGFAYNSMKLRRPGPLLRQAFILYRDFIYYQKTFNWALLKASSRDVHAEECPSCWGPREAGDLPPEIMDVGLAVDACMTQTRAESASKYDFSSMRPRSMLNNYHLDRAKNLYETTRGDSVKIGKNETACDDNWKAKDGGGGEGTNKGKTDTGLVALVCRHNVCLKLVNMYKTGEKMYYALALLMYIYEEVDPTVRVAFLYDIGCNFLAHLRKRKMLVKERAEDLPNSSTEKQLRVGVAAFHAYAHNWFCQTEYHPRVLEGFALSDGEGCERLWSSLASLVRLCRTASSSLRKNNIHHRREHINKNRRDNLMCWFRNRLNTTIKRLEAADKELNGVYKKTFKARQGSDGLAGRYTEEVLRDQWKRQQLAQSKEGVSQEAADTRKEYEEVGELLLLRDEVMAIMPKINRLIEEKKHAELAHAQQLIDKLHRSEKDTDRLVRERVQAFVGAGVSAQEAEALFRVHAAKCRLRREVVTMRNVMEPMRQSEAGVILQVGQPLLQQVQRSSKPQGKKGQTSTSSFNKAVELYNSLQPPPRGTLASVTWSEALSMEDIDPFWRDVLFDRIQQDPWATDEHCRRGIKALLLRDRCREELALLIAELARTVRWAEQRYNSITSTLRYRAQRARDWEARDTGDSQDEGVEVRRPVRPNDTDEILTGESPLLVAQSMEYSLALLAESHSDLELRWYSDGMVDLWTSYVKPSTLHNPELESFFGRLCLRAIRHVENNNCKRSQAEAYAEDEQQYEDEDERDDGRETDAVVAAFAHFGFGGDGNEDDHQVTTGAVAEVVRRRGAVIITDPGDSADEGGNGESGDVEMLE